MEVREMRKIQQRRLRVRKRVTFLRRESCSRNQTKTELQEGVHAQICQVLSMLIAFGIVKDIKDLDKNTFGGMVGMKA